MKPKKPYPIVEYAHLIGKNTAEFTASDLGRFLDWWKTWGKQSKKEGEQGMDMKQKNNFEAFQKNKHKNENKEMEVVNEEDVKMIDEENEEVEVVDEQQHDQVIVELGLTQEDIGALTWGIGELLDGYDFHEWSKTKERLEGIKQALEGVDI